MNNNLEEDEELINTMNVPRLYNASKVSGRLKNGLGIGVFNGITAAQFGQALNILDSTEREVDDFSIVQFQCIMSLIKTSKTIARQRYSHHTNV